MRLALATVILAWCGTAGAWTVGSGFSDPCHEILTGRAYQGFILELPLRDGAAPQGATWRKMTGLVPKELLISMKEYDITEEQTFWLVSLIIGVRSPDTDGHSIMNLENLRQLHSDPSAAGQYAHSLRAPGDDLAAGDQAAIEGTRRTILDLVARAQSYLDLPAAKRVIEAQVYLDFYGRVDVEVSAPYFYLGRALHVLQDTFSHTLRAQDDLHRIVTVMNYADAITSGFDEARDGLAHSDSMDRCLDDGMQAIAAAAVAASEDLFYAVREQFHGADPAAVEHVLDKWMVFEAGCTLANDFCGNTEHLALAREKQTEPYVEALFGCRTAPGNSLGLVLLLALLFGIRLRNPLTR